MKPRKPILQSVRLLVQVTERVRELHYSLGTEKITCIGLDFLIAGMVRIAN